jgi:hypothetical protein
MTVSENFVSRWARLKRESDAGLRTEPTEGGQQPDAIASTDTEAPAAHHADAEVVEEPFDPASLPSLESITADTDIRGFLQRHVPTDLTRAALRQTWASDPAIRDFIGIAENQWDFNDPNAISGFGPMQENDNLQDLLAQALGEKERLAEMIPEMPETVEPSRSAVNDGEGDELDSSVRKTADASSADEMRNLADSSSQQGAITRSDVVAEADDPPRNHRSHGGALPR